MSAKSVGIIGLDVLHCSGEAHISMIFVVFPNRRSQPSGIFLIDILQSNLNLLLSMARLEEAHLQNESIPNGQGQPTETTPLLPGEREQEQPGKYSVFTNSQKHWIILTAALASSFSPFSANIYYPALNSIAEDLGVSKAQINLTITTYMVGSSFRSLFIR